MAANIPFLPPNCLESVLLWSTLCAVSVSCCVQAFVPRLLQQEKFIFDELVSYVWTHTFVPAVAASRARPANAALAAGVVKRSGQEAALRKWLGALEAVSSQLKGLGREGHTSTLRHQVRGVRVCEQEGL
jgi:hypothetical protein